MQYQSFLIKYAEIGTKGKNRYMFEDALIRQIRYALSSVDGEFDVTKESGRIYVKALGEYDYDDTIEALKRVFGIADICPMVQIDDKDYENLKKHVVEYMDQVYPDKNITFKVDARRGDKQYPVSSEQINRDMGEAILDAFPEMKVDVHHPDVLLRVEIRQKVNLFSLMTTTVPSMEETIKQLRESAPWVKVMVGGAVLTQEYADTIGADAYCKDAMASVHYAETVI